MIITTKILMTMTMMIMTMPPTTPTTKAAADAEKHLTRIADARVQGHVLHHDAFLKGFCPGAR
jgi:hypothetical protein